MSKFIIRKVPTAEKTMKNIEANRFNLYAGIITSGLFAIKKLTDHPHVNDDFRIFWLRGRLRKY